MFSPCKIFNELRAPRQFVRKVQGALGYAACFCMFFSRVLKTSLVFVDSGHRLFPLFCRKRGSFEKIVHSNTVNWSHGSNRELLRAMMMTACDVAAITKPWEIQHKVCIIYCQEIIV